MREMNHFLEETGLPDLGSGVSDGLNAMDLFSGDMPDSEEDPGQKISDIAAVAENTVPEAPKKKKEAVYDTKAGLLSEQQNTKTDADAEAMSAEKGENLFDTLITQAKEKETKTVIDSLAGNLPVFSYAKAREEITDPSVTFEKLREEKAEDFPELDDPESVTWKMVYGAVSKTVISPRKSTVIGMKKEIEKSKSFRDGLKQAKDGIVCKVTPMVTAKKKGVAAYKGFFHTVCDAAQSSKAIGYVPARDGKIYEVRSNAIGTFVAPCDKVNIAAVAAAGFTPALPKIPFRTLCEIVSFFKAYSDTPNFAEVMVNVYWLPDKQQYHVEAPKQTVSRDNIIAEVREHDETRYVHVMEVHSHNRMSAFFSPTDDRDERATRLYAVIGRLNQMFPEVQVRAAVGGKFIPLAAETVFEGLSVPYPLSWNANVSVRQEEVHKK